MKLPTDPQGVALLSGSLDLSISWGFLGRIYDGEATSSTVEQTL